MGERLGDDSDVMLAQWRNDAACFAVGGDQPRATSKCICELGADDRNRSWIAHLFRLGDGLPAPVVHVHITFPAGEVTRRLRCRFLARTLGSFALVGTGERHRSFAQGRVNALPFFAGHKRVQAGGEEKQSQRKHEHVPKRQAHSDRQCHRLTSSRGSNM